MKEQTLDELWEALEPVSSNDLPGILRGLAPFAVVEELMGIRGPRGNTVGLGVKGALELAVKLALWLEKEGR